MKTKMSPLSPHQVEILRISCQGISQRTNKDYLAKVMQAHIDIDAIMKECESLEYNHVRVVRAWAHIQNFSYEEKVLLFELLVEALGGS